MKSKYSPEKQESPETFAAKVNEICDLYANARELAKEGGHVVSTDEMTGIQALEHKYPDKLPLPGHPETMDFEYIRHGTASLVGYFDIASGVVCPPYLNETRNETDFCESVRQIIARDPEKEWIFICDDLNTHKSESLVNLVAEASHVEEGLLQYKYG